MNEEADRLVVDLTTSGNKGVDAINCVPVFARATLNVICRAAFGKRLDIADMAVQWRYLTDNLRVISLAAMLFPYNIVKLLPFGPLAAYLRRLERLDTTLLDAIKRARAEAAQGVESDDLMGAMAALVNDETQEPLISDKLMLDESKTSVCIARAQVSLLITHSPLSVSKIPLGRSRDDVKHACLGMLLPLPESFIAGSTARRERTRAAQRERGD